LVKVTPAVNFINILQASFEPISFGQKITKPKLQAHKSYAKQFCMKWCSENVGEIDTCNSLDIAVIAPK